MTKRVLATVLLVLSGCSKELPNDEVELHAAVAYVTWGMEEGTGKFSADHVDRKVLSDGVQYTVFSKKDGPAGMVMTVRSPRKCVFTMEGLRTDGVLHTLDFNKATKVHFENSPDSLSFTEIEGPQVFCEGNTCSDEKMFLMLEQRGLMQLPENRAIGFRKSKAVDLIRKICPGKPF